MVCASFLQQVQLVAFHGVSRTYVVQVHPVIRVLHRWFAPKDKNNKKNDDNNKNKNKNNNNDNDKAEKETETGNGTGKEGEGEGLEEGHNLAQGGRERTGKEGEGEGLEDDDIIACLDWSWGSSVQYPDLGPQVYKHTSPSSDKHNKVKITSSGADSDEVACPLLARSWGNAVEVLALLAYPVEINGVTTDQVSFKYVVVAASTIEQLYGQVLSLKWVGVDRLVVMGSRQALVLNQYLNVLEQYDLPTSVSAAVITSTRGAGHIQGKKMDAHERTEALSEPVLASVFARERIVYVSIFFVFESICLYIDISVCLCVYACPISHAHKAKNQPLPINRLSTTTIDQPTIDCQLTPFIIIHHHSPSTTYQSPTHTHTHAQVYPNPRGAAATTSTELD